MSTTIFSTSPLSSGSNYTSTLPSLSADQMGALSSRRQAIDARFKDAMTRVDDERTRVSGEGLLARNQQKRGFRRETRDGMAELASANVARNPRQGGRWLRDQRDAESAAASELERDLTERRRALQLFLEDSRRGRDEELAMLDMEEANMRTDLAMLFPAAGWF